MEALKWWLIPVGATVIAVIWVSWAARPRPPVDTHDSLAEHQRFRQAMDHLSGPDAAPTTAEGAQPPPERPDPEPGADPGADPDAGSGPERSGR